MNRRTFLISSAASVGSLASVAVHAQVRPCPPPSFGVEGGSQQTTACNAGSVLSSVAASLAPGSWGQLTPAPSNLSGALGVGNIAGNMIVYHNASAWNPVTRKIEFLGQDHGWGQTRHVQYIEASNAFVFVNDIGNPESHGYDHYDVNPHTGDLYYKPYHYGSNGQLWRMSTSGAWNRSLPVVPISQQVAGGCCWWSGSMSGVGAQGAFVHYSPQYGDLAAYDPVANRWVSIPGVPPPFGDTYHSVMAYSPRKNVAVFGGGNAQTRKIWRLNSDRSVTALQDLPSGATLGVYKGNLVNEPQSGNFLVLSGGSLWELDPAGSGTWTRLSGSRTPPSAVANPSAGETVTLIELPDHGAIAALSMSARNGSMYLYHHS